MIQYRLIPCLLLKDNGLVKTQKLSNPKYVGDPINVIKILNDKEVDELIVLDIMASKEGNSPNYSLIEQFAGECFMPLCYGGGISTIEQAQKLFSIGVEKISIQTGSLKDLHLISEIAKKFGNQSIVVSVDIKKNIWNQYKLYNEVGSKNIKNWKGFVRDAANAGAGEILINAVDKDGMMNGMDLQLIQEASEIVNVPIIAIGGVGSLSDISQAIEAGASAIAAGAFFVYHGPHRAVLVTYPTYNELKKTFSTI
jgi:cyclase